MARKFAQRRYVIFTITLIYLIGESHGIPVLGLGGQDLANEIRQDMTDQSTQVLEAMRKSILAMKSSIYKAASALEASANAYRDQVTELKKTAQRLDRSVDIGIEEMGEAMKDAIRITKSILEKLSSSGDPKIQHVRTELHGSVDKTAEEFGASIRHIGDSIVEMSKQVQLRLNSSDLIHVASETKEGLIQAVERLTTNWKVGVNTADLKDVGQAAAQELAKALQNIKVRIEVSISINSELRRAILYICVAVGLAFSVLFVAIVVSLKGCRRCCVQACSALGQGIASGRGNGSEEEDETNREKDDSTKKRKVEGRAKSSRRESRKLNTIEELSDASDSTEDEETKKRSRRLTKSLADYKKFPRLMDRWKRKVEREYRQKHEMTVMNTSGK